MDYTSFGTALREAREMACMSRRTASENLHISPDMLKLYELNKHLPDPDLVQDMAELYHAPELIFLRCVKGCPIGRTFRYRVLNRVNRDLPAMLTKYKSELQEVMNMIDDLILVTLNKKSKEEYNEQEQQEIFNLALEICDISHNSDEIKIELMRTFGIEVIKQAIREHHTKCYRNGYLSDKKEKAPLAKAL